MAKTIGWNRIWDHFNPDADRYKGCDPVEYLYKHEGDRVGRYANWCCPVCLKPRTPYNNQSEAMTRGDVCSDECWLQVLLYEETL